MKQGILFSCALGMLLALLFYVPTAEVILGAPPTPTPTIATSPLDRIDLPLPQLSTSAVLDGARTSPTDAGWPQVGGNARHTGRSPYAVPIGMPQLRWRHTIGHIGSPTTPIIAPDGKVYVAYRSSLSVLVALNPDGSVRWSREGLGSPVIGSDGTVYAPGQDETEVWRTIAALDPGGTERWRYTPEQRTEIGQLTSGPDGTIYATGKMAGFDGAVVLALRPDGSLRWAFQGAGLDYTFQPAAVAPDGSIYIVTRRHVVALTPDGKLKWHFDPHGEMQAWPVVGDDGTIYAVAGCCVSDSGGYFYALNPDGSVKWDFPIDRAYGMYAAPALGQDGTIYVAGADQYQGVSFYALSSDGRLKWKYERPEARPPFEHFGTPVIDSNGTIYVGSSDSRVFAFSPEGVLLWVFIGDPEEEAIIGSPSPGPNGLLYAPISADGLVALETSLQPEIRPWRDTVIVSGLPDRSFERLDFMGVGYDADTGIWRSLVQFNWPELPGLVPRETILALPLAGSSEPPQEMDITVYPVLNRGLGLVTWQNQPPTAEEPLTTLHVGTETGIWVLLNLSWPPPEHGVMLQGPESGETNLKLFLTTEHESGISAVAAFDLNIPPSSQVLPLPPYSPPEFRVSWSGFDSDGQIAGYTVQVREGAEGEWRDWVENTTVEAAQFAGEHGQTYGFRVRCWDNDGAMEPYWLIEDTQTTVDGIAPTAEISPLPEAQERTWWIVSWSGSDDLSGVAGYQVQVQEGDGPWRLWIQDTAFTQALFVSRQPGTRYAFRVRARDRAGNWGAWTPDEAAVTVSGADPSGLFTAELPLIRR